MKYQAKQLSNGNWAVFAGKRYFLSSSTIDKATAKQMAAAYSAEWYMDQAEKLISKMDLRSAMDLGHQANNVIDAVEERQRQEDPNFSEADPRGWLA